MTAFPYPLSVIADMLGGKLVGTGDPHIAHLAIDSRKPLPAEDALFIALPGERHDGHRYIPELVGRGVRAFIVRDEPGEELLANAAFVVVPDPLLAMQRLVAWHRASHSLPVIGITGSNGKTVVKEWLFQLLRGEERIVRSPGSWNSQVGVPQSVWSIRPSHTLGIFEAGISKPGEMERLEAIIRPTIGVFTNLGPAHGEGFDGDAAKVEAKFKLFRNCEVVVCCTDHSLVHKAVTALHPPRLCNWSRRGAAFVQVVHESVQGASTELLVRQGGNDLRFSLPFTDTASVDNALTCITLLLHMKRSPQWIAGHLSELEPVEMRLRTMEGVHDTTIIDDSYSSDLASLNIALDHQVRVAHGRERVVVLGDIVESALDPEELYAEVGQQLARARPDRIITVGPALATQRSRLPMGSRHYANSEVLLDNEDPRTFSGSVVLVKGARHLHLEKVVQRWQHQVHGTELVVDIESIRHNLNHYRRLVAPGVKVMAMVKAFGYGSGAVELARLFAHERVDYLGVAYADEGIALRQQGIDTPILVMNPEPVPQETLHRFDLEAEVYDMRSFQAAIDLARNVKEGPPIHIKLDTGMHRLGFMVDELPALLERLQDAPVRVASILSHLAASEDPRHDGFTRDQLALFSTMATRIGEVLGYRPLWHVANSGAIERFTEAHFDMVRLGIGLHGVGATDEETNKLLPTASLRTVVAQVKHIPAGDTIGYGRAGPVKADMRLAVLPIGYADGFPRRAGNGAGRVWIKGTEARTVGNICMDMCMVDITSITCQAGDEAIVFDAQHPLTDYAMDLGTIPYEALTSIAPRVKRVYTHS
jgi:alanine racemase